MTPAAGHLGAAAPAQSDGTPARQGIKSTHKEAHNMEYHGFRSVREYESECARLGFTTRRVPFHHESGAADRKSVV